MTGCFQGAVIRRHGAYPQQGCVGSDSSHTSRLENLCLGELYLPLSQLITDPPCPESADGVGPEVSALSDPPTQVLLPFQQGLWPVSTRQKDLSGCSG